MSVRLRTDFALQIGGEIFTGSINMRDQVNLPKTQKAHPEAPEGPLLVWLAAVRLGHFDGDYEAFIDSVEDMDITPGDELPPLVKPPSSDS